MEKVKEGITIAKGTADIAAEFADFKSRLNDPAFLQHLFTDILFKKRFEFHIDLVCLPRGKESPNHDYAILYRDRENSKDSLELKMFEAILKTFNETTQMNLKLEGKQVRKDSIVYNAIFLDISKPIIEG